MGYGRKVYVIHCDKCNRMIDKDEKNNGAGCPPKKAVTEFKGAPMFSLPSYKRGENYPQWAPNLPGDGIVHSYEDYKEKAKRAGQVVVGDSHESRKRSKFYNRKQATLDRKDYVKGAR